MDVEINCKGNGSRGDGMGQPFGKTYDSLLGAIGWQVLNGIQDKDVRRGQERDAIPLGNPVNGLGH